MYFISYSLYINHFVLFKNIEFVWCNFFFIRTTLYIYLYILGFETCFEQHYDLLYFKLFNQL